MIPKSLKEVEIYISIIYLTETDFFFGWSWFGIYCCIKVASNQLGFAKRKNKQHFIKTSHETASSQNSSASEAA